MEGVCTGVYLFYFIAEQTYKYTKMYFLLLLYLLVINGGINGSGGGRLQNFCPFYLFGKKESARLPPRELSAGAGRWRWVIMKDCDDPS